MKDRKKVMDYLRYHHFNTMPIRDSHKYFIEVLGEVEEIGKVMLGDAETLENGWCEIKSILKKMSNEQFTFLARRIERLREKRI